MCGIAGIANHSEASNLAYLCLYALQHRGQESAGIISSDGQKFHGHREMGLVAEIFSKDILTKLSGRYAAGHVRYSTAGSSALENAQPFLLKTPIGNLAVVHNGNITNAVKLRRELEEKGSVFKSTMDTEVIMHEIAMQFKGMRAGEYNNDVLADSIATALKKIEGAYSLIFLAEKALIAVRDPKGFRPLVLGTINGAHVVVSETCALDIIGAEFVREIEPGEIVIFDKTGVHSFKNLASQGKKAHCVFEYIYFARPDSHIFGRSVYEVRKGYGRQLAKEQPADADIVIPVPDSGVPAAIGYSQAIGIPFETGLIRNHYVGRTFIEPKKEIRHFGVRIKLNPVKETLKGKKVVVVDDSIVRGTTCMKIIEMIRSAGAKEVHMRVSSPPTAWPCFYGIDTPTREELVASKKSPDEIRKFIGADTLGYLSEEGLYWFEKLFHREWFCDACFTGDYPVALTDAAHIMELASRR